MTMRDHPLREQLTNEVHARPFASLTAPARATYLAMVSGEAGGAADRAHLGRLCERFGIAPPGRTGSGGETHLMADFGAFQLKWERHTEFCSYSVFVPGQADEEAGAEPFSRPALAALPADWLAALPGERLVGIHAELVAGDRPEPDAAALTALFGSDAYAGSLMSGGAAAAWTDFTIKSDGFGWLLVHDRHLRPRQAGRLMQRLFEIEAYRMMALLALPLARREMPVLNAAGDRLAAITSEMGGLIALEDEQRLLDELTRLSQESERVASATSYRFGAARAYHALVERRIEELREERIEGVQTIREFMERRLTPAMSTCEAMGQRIDRLSRQLARAGQLLRTRVEIQLEAQNRDLLRTMNRRAHLQLRLQETVEGLSVAAISYYAVGLIHYALKALQAAGLALDVELLTGLAILPVAGAVWLGVRRVRRMVARRSKADWSAEG